MKPSETFKNKSTSTCFAATRTSHVFNNVSRNKHNSYLRRKRDALNDSSPDTAVGKVCDIEAVVDYHTFHSHFKENLNFTLSKVLILYELSNEISSTTKFGVYDGFNIKVASIKIMTNYTPSDSVSSTISLNRKGFIVFFNLSFL